MFNPLAKVRSWFDQRQAERRSKDDAAFLKTLEQQTDQALTLNRIQKRALARSIMAQPSSRHYRKGHVEHCATIRAWREKVSAAKALASVHLAIPEVTPTRPASKRTTFSPLGLFRHRTEPAIQDVPR